MLSQDSPSKPLEVYRSFLGTGSNRKWNGGTDSPIPPSLALYPVFLSGVGEILHSILVTSFMGILKGQAYYPGFPFKAVPLFCPTLGRI